MGKGMDWETPEERREWLDQVGEIYKQGPDATIRLRAEVLLNREKHGEFKLTDEERERLDHIAVVGTEDDREYLGTFDRFYQDEDYEDDE